ncbi:MAG: hypothetical protein JKY32_07195 [Rhizobiales bacterium]|nr:hypothetical protein [Hyphomicrobiales bacterium]
MRRLMTTGAAMAAIAGMVLSREVGVDILLDDTDPRPPLDLSPDLYGGINTRADRRSSFKMTSTRNYNFEKNRAAAKAARAARKKTRRAK